MLEAHFFHCMLGFLGQRPQCVPEVGAVIVVPFVTQDVGTNPGIELVCPHFRNEEPSAHTF